MSDEGREEPVLVERVKPNSVMNTWDAPVPPPPQPASQWQRMTWKGKAAVVVVGLVVVVAVLLNALGVVGERDAQAEPDVEVVAGSAVTEPAAAEAPSTADDRPDDETASTEVRERVEPFEPAEASATAVMPDVVGLDLQLAQDTIQEAGVLVSRSEDATGQGRVQLWDRSWVVVRQEPRPGTPIEEGDPLLHVVKEDER